MSPSECELPLNCNRHLLDGLAEAVATNMHSVSAAKSLVVVLTIVILPE